MKALFPGSFDPIHEGHLEIIKRAAQIFDEVTVLVAQNPKKNYSDIIERTNFAKKEIAKINLDNVKVDFWNGQIMEYYEKNYFDVLVRSIRNSFDIEWEEEIANIYKKQNVDVEILYLMADNNSKKYKSNKKIDSKKNSLFVFDIDGTILSSDRTISKSIKNVFKKLQENGHQILLATGRTPCHTFNICEELNFKGYVLGCCGGSIYNLKTKKYEITNDLIPAEDIELLIKNAYKYKLELAWSNGKKVHNVNFSPAKRDTKYDEWEECKLTLNDGVVEMSIKANHEVMQDMKSDINSKLSNKTFGVESSGCFYEITPTSSDKFTAIEKMQKILGISNENTYVFGDSENDIAMIKKAGTGIAMGNSCESLKKLANIIIGDNDSPSIEKYLINQGFINE